MSQHVEILILGAGPTGIGAARRLLAAEHPSWLMLDGADRPGGMAVTEKDEQGFLWDLGGHVIHSHYAPFNEAMALEKDWVHSNRGGFVRVDSRWVPTPIQRFLGNLRQGQQICDEIQVAATKESDPQNLEDYHVATFGKTLNGLFFEPFGYKQWAHRPRGLEHSWTSLRGGSKLANVPAPATVVTSGDKPSDTSTFEYPRYGTGCLWQSVSDTLPASRQRYNATVSAIDLVNRKVTLSTGEVISYTRCISSLPLNRAIDLANVESPNTAIPQSLAGDLKHSSTTIVGLGFNGSLPEVLHGRTWIYGADPDVLFHRATIVTNFSQSMSGEGRWSVMFETSSSAERPITTDTQELAQLHLAELRRWGAIGEDEQPLSIWSRHLELGYPIPFLQRDGVVLDTLQRFEKFGFLQRGRFGGWRYEVRRGPPLFLLSQSSNQDYAFMQGIEAVDLLLEGKEESVYWPARSDPVAPVVQITSAAAAPAETTFSLHASTSPPVLTSPVRAR